MKRFLVLFPLSLSLLFPNYFIGVGVDSISNIETSLTTSDVFNKAVHHRDNKGVFSFKRSQGLNLIFGSETENTRTYLSLGTSSFSTSYNLVEYLRKDNDIIDVKYNKKEKKIHFYKLLFNFDLKENFSNPSFEFYLGVNIGYGVLQLSDLKQIKTQAEYQNLYDIKPFKDAKGLIYGSGGGIMYNISKSSKIDLSYKVQEIKMKSKASVTIKPIKYKLNYEMELTRFTIVSLSYIYKF